MTGNGGWHKTNCTHPSLPKYASRKCYIAQNFDIFNQKIAFLIFHYIKICYWKIDILAETLAEKLYSKWDTRGYIRKNIRFSRSYISPPNKESLSPGMERHESRLTLLTITQKNLHSHFPALVLNHQLAPLSHLVLCLRIWHVAWQSYTPPPRITRSEQQDSTEGW